MKVATARHRNYDGNYGVDLTVGTGPGEDFVGVIMLRFPLGRDLSRHMNCLSPQLRELVGQFFGEAIHERLSERSFDWPIETQITNIDQNPPMVSERLDDRQRVEADRIAKVFSKDREVPEDDDGLPLWLNAVEARAEALFKIEAFLTLSAYEAAQINYMSARSEPLLPPESADPRSWSSQVDDLLSAASRRFLAMVDVDNGPLADIFRILQAQGNPRQDAAELCVEIEALRQCTNPNGDPGIVGREPSDDSPWGEWWHFIVDRFTPRLEGERVNFPNSLVLDLTAMNQIMGIISGPVVVIGISQL